MIPKCCMTGIRCARVLDSIRDGFRDGVSYEDIYRRLLFGGDCPADQYLLLADFVSYCDAGRRHDGDLR